MSCDPNSLISVTLHSMFIGDSAIITLPVLVSETQSLGVYQFNFTNVIISDINNQDIASTALENGDITVVDRIYLNAKVFLQGNYDSNTGLLTDILRSNGLIPTILLLMN